MDPAMTRDEHPDEGTIHAWLDGELDPTAAAAVDTHVRSCASCAARVAEARGLIAGTSRVIGALDDVPAAAPAWGSGSTVAARGAASTWRRLRLTPTRAAIAATLIVAAGVTLTYQRTGPDTVVTPSPRVRGEAETASSAATPTAAAGAIGPARDPLLDSAVKRNIAAAQPPRAIEAAPERGVPVPPALRSPTTLPDTVAAARVAVGRMAAQAARDSTSAVADRARAGIAAAAPGAPPLEGRVAAVAKVVDTASSPGRVERSARPMVQTATSIPLPTECYRIESASGASAVWGAVEAPFIVALNASGGGARVLTADGVDTGTGATWSRGSADSVLLRLRRIGFQGTLALGAPGEVRAGVMRSAPVQLALSEVVTTAQGATAAEPGRVRARTRAAAPTTNAPAGKAGAPAAAVATDASSAAPAVPIVARRTACPSQ